MKMHEASVSVTLTWWLQSAKAAMPSSLHGQLLKERERGLRPVGPGNEIKKPCVHLPFRRAGVPIDTTREGETAIQAD